MMGTPLRVPPRRVCESIWMIEAGLVLTTPVHWTERLIGSDGVHQLGFKKILNGFNSTPLRFLGPLPLLLPG